MNKKMLITGIITAGILIGGTSIVGASMNDNDAVIMKDQTVKSEKVMNTEGPARAKGILSIDEVKEIALTEQDGHIDDIELETDDGYTYYEVEIENHDVEYDIYIEAYTGEVLKVEIDDNDSKTLGNIISSEDAKRIAVETVGGKVTELGLDEDDNRYEYEIELKTNNGEVEMTIDAITGEILEQELDD